VALPSGLEAGASFGVIYGLIEVIKIMARKRENGRATNGHPGNGAKVVLAVTAGRDAQQMLDYLKEVKETLEKIYQDGTVICPLSTKGERRPKRPMSGRL